MTLLSWEDNCPLLKEGSDDALTVDHGCDESLALSEATEFRACINLFALLGTCMRVRRARFVAGLRPLEAVGSRGRFVPLFMASLIS